MTMKKRNNIFLLLATILLVSCIDEIKFNNDLIDPELVINGFPSRDSIITIQVGASKPIPGTQNNFTWIDDANVVLYVNGEEKETLEATAINYAGSDDYYVGSANLPDTEYRAKTIATPGNVYKLVVTHPDYKTASCETIIPEVVSISGITATTEYIQEEYSTDKVLKFKLKFKDPADEKNYYRLTLKYTTGTWQSYNYEDPEDTSGIIYVQHNVPGYGFSTEDPVLNPDEDANDFLFDSPSNEYNLFNDDLINGTEYELKFSLYVDSYYNYDNNQEPVSHVGEFYRVTLNLSSLTREAYLYIKSAATQLYYGIDIFSEPTQVFSNVENGTGIFGGYSSSIDSVAEGEYPVEGIHYEYYDYYY